MRTSATSRSARRAETPAAGSSGAHSCESSWTCPASGCNPGDAEFDWQEPVHQVIFRLLAGPDLVGSVMRGAVRVWCGPLLLGEVSLAIRVTASTPGTGPPAVTESVPRYRKIFPSYSRDDRAIVDAFAEVARALGDQYLQDVIVLRSGERWRARLPELIEEADIFQLFWSSNSMRSRYCREEWEHALALRRPLFVRPLYWEDPLPQDPARGLPPDALRELEFVKVQPHPLHGGAPASSGRAPETGPDPVRSGGRWPGVSAPTAWACAAGHPSRGPRGAEQGRHQLRPARVWQDRAGRQGAAPASRLRPASETAASSLRPAPPPQSWSCISLSPLPRAFLRSRSRHHQHAAAPAPWDLGRSSQPPSPPGRKEQGLSDFRKSGAP